MKNYYTLLGIRSSSNVAEIKSAYKRLAKAYHPDKNPGDPSTEEKFKYINEAYQILKDPIKRARYNVQISTTLSTQHKGDNKREPTRTNYRQPRQSEPYYKIDKTYFKNQGLTILAFIIFAGLCFTSIKAFQYLEKQNEARHYNNVTIALQMVKSSFTSNQFNKGFQFLDSLAESKSIDSRIEFTKDSLLIELQKVALRKYESKEYATAISDYFLLHEYQEPESLETKLKIAQCQYALGNYNEAVIELKDILLEQSYDLELLYEISLIYLNDIHNAKEALIYLDKGQKIIRQKSINTIGTVFQFTLNPEDYPIIYFEILEARAEANIVLSKFEDAIVDCNHSIYLRPDNGRPYLLRAMANIGLNQIEMICSDLQKAKSSGSGNLAELEQKYCH